MFESNNAISVFLAAFVLVAILLRLFTRKNMNVKARYDERQQLMLGRAYGVAFQTVILASLFYIIVDFFNYPRILVQPSLVVFTIIMIGICALSAHRIWHDAFFMIGQRGRIYVILLLIVDIQQAWMSYFSITNHLITESGMVTYSGGVSIVLTMCFAFILLTLGIKRLKERGEE